MKIFLDDRSVVFTASPPAQVLPVERMVWYENPEQLETAYIEFKVNGSYKKLIIVDPQNSAKAARDAFLLFFKQIEAAGGLVTNEKCEILFIHRMGLWDLPKGKIDPKDIQQALNIPGAILPEPGFFIPDIGNNHKQPVPHPVYARIAAIREVKEETGLKMVSITNDLPSTFHIYSQKEKHILKKTFWFRMVTDSAQPLKPQASEGIFLAKWVSNNGLPCVMDHTYASIKELIAGETKS